jgi:hypothetical protein
MGRSKPPAEPRKRKLPRLGRPDQGIRKDQRGQEQPADKKRALRNR